MYGRRYFENGRRIILLPRIRPANTESRDIGLYVDDDGARQSLDGSALQL